MLPGQEMDARRGAKHRQERLTHAEVPHLRIGGFDEDQYPGRPYEFETPVGPGGVFRSRAYLVNGRLYQLTAVGTKAFATSEQANQFLGSLKLTK